MLDLNKVVLPLDEIYSGWVGHLCYLACLVSNSLQLHDDAFDSIPNFSSSQLHLASIEKCVPDKDACQDRHFHNSPDQASLCWIGVDPAVDIKDE